MIPKETANINFSEEDLECLDLSIYGITYRTPNYYILLNDNGEHSNFMLEHNKPYICDIKLYKKNMMKI